jgi:hypothetical protein
VVDYRSVAEPVRKEGFIAAGVDSHADTGPNARAEGLDRVMRLRKIVVGRASESLTVVQGFVDVRQSFSTRFFLTFEHVIELTSNVFRLDVVVDYRS